MGDMTYDDYEEMFYKFAKPLKIYRSRLPLPYRTDEEISQEKYVKIKSSLKCGGNMHMVNFMCTSGKYENFREISLVFVHF